MKAFSDEKADKYEYYWKLNAIDRDNTHYKLEYYEPGTWSIKDNLLF